MRDTRLYTVTLMGSSSNLVNVGQHVGCQGLRRLGRYPVRAQTWDMHGMVQGKVSEKAPCWFVETRQFQVQLLGEGEREGKRARERMSK